MSMNEDGKVVSLQDYKKIVPNEYELQRVELLEMLETIKSKVLEGEVEGIALVLIGKDALYTGNCYSTPYPVVTIGELETLKREIIDARIDLRHHEAGYMY